MDSILSALFIRLLPQHRSKGREGGEAFGEGLLVAGIADAHAVRLLEAVAGGDERARLAVHALAEVVGRDVEVVVHERSRTGLGLRVIEVLMRGDPRVEDGEILAHDGLVAAEHGVAVAQGDGRDGVVEHAAADEVIVAVGEEGASCVAIQPMRSPASENTFDMLLTEMPFS